MDTEQEQATCPHGFPLQIRAECPSCKKLFATYQDQNFETLYRYENPETPYDDRREGIVSRKELVGSWFTNSRQDLATYIKARQPGGRIVLVRVPKSELTSYDATTHPETKDMDIEKGNYVIPENIRVETQMQVPLTIQTASPKKFLMTDWGKVNEFLETQLTHEQLFRGMGTN